MDLTDFSGLRAQGESPSVSYLDGGCFNSWPFVAFTYLDVLLLVVETEKDHPSPILPTIRPSLMTAVLSRAPPSIADRNPFESSTGQQNMRKRKFFERAFASSRAASRDMFHTTRSLYRREHVSELISTIEPPQDVVQVKPSAPEQDDEAMKTASGDDGDLTLQLKSFIPGVKPTMNETDEHSDSIHRTRPLTPEANDQREIQQPDMYTLFPRPPSPLTRSKTQISQSNKSKRLGYVPPDPTERPSHVQFRPPIPPRKDSLPQKRALLNLVDQSTSKGDMRDSMQSVTAYVSAEYSEIPATPTLTMTSWLSDPDGPPDDWASWNRPIKALQPVSENTGSVSATTRPQLGPRSKTAPGYSTVEAPTELTDAAYERVLREKLRHHAGQVRKRIDTSTYYSPTVRQNEMEIHLTFVRAAEEILKQSPIWHGAPDDTMKMKYLLEI